MTAPPVTYRRHYNQSEMALIRAGRLAEAKTAWTKRNLGK